MTLRELMQEVHKLCTSINDDAEFCRKEFDLVREFCSAKNYCLTRQETEYIEALGYDYTQFSDYQERKLEVRK